MAVKPNTKIPESKILEKDISTPSILKIIAVSIAIFTLLPVSVSASSAYLWQSCETGTLGSIADSPTYGGYEFSPGSNAYATKLCGYFQGENTVSLYDSSFNLLAQTKVASANSWNCKPIKPVLLKKNSTYYVVGNLNNERMNYRYQCCTPKLMPKNCSNLASIKGGITQASADPFGSKIKLHYDLILGLVDVLLQFQGTAADQTIQEQETTEEPQEYSSAEPKISNPKPSGTVTKAKLTMSVTTAKNATCRYSKHNRSYSKMGGYFTTTGKITHKKTRTMNNGSYTYYVRCKDKSSGNTNSTSTKIKFKVDVPEDDTTPPDISNIKVSPDSGTAGDSFIITAKVTDESSIDSVTATITLDGDEVADITLYDDGDHNDGSANNDTFGGKFKSSGADPGEYSVTIEAEDEYGNIQTEEDAATFTIEEEGDDSDDDSTDECVTDSIKLANKVDGNKMMDNLEYITQKPRPFGGSWNKETADWIKEKLDSYGLDARLETSSDGSINVVADLGSGKKSIIVSGGHRDSVSASPGAIDNGGGTVIVMEMARVFASCKDNLKNYKLSFALFDGEEVGFYGSSDYVDKHSGENIERVLNFDCHGYKGDDFIDVYRTADDLSTSADKACSSLSLPCEKLGAAPGFTDHVPFENRGIGYISALQSCGPGYHTSEDAFDLAAPEQLSWGAKLGVYVLSDLYLK